MALQKNVVLKNNFNEDSVFNNAYIKVDFVTGNAQKIFCKVGTYKSKDGDLLKKDQYEFLPNLTETNFIAQAYEHLKTLQEFAGATNC